MLITEPLLKGDRIEITFIDENKKESKKKGIFSRFGVESIKLRGADKKENEIGGNKIKKMRNFSAEERVNKREKKKKRESDLISGYLRKECPIPSHLSLDDVKKVITEYIRIPRYTLDQIKKKEMLKKGDKIKLKLKNKEAMVEGFFSSYDYCYLAIENAPTPGYYSGRYILMDNMII